MHFVKNVVKIRQVKHTDEERAWIGTYCTEELKEAQRQNYKILKIFEIWHFEKSSNELFKGYINLFLKGKQEASGLPEGVTTNEEIDAYILDYFNHNVFNWWLL